MIPNNSSQTSTKLFMGVLIIISMCGPLGMNIILPSISSFQLVFETDYAMSQLTLTVYLAAIAVGQLIYGPLSDRFGRRPIVIAGLLIFIAGGGICIFATSIEMMIGGRMVQALGGCAGMVMGRAMVRDRFSAAQAASVIAYMTMAIVVAPSLAPMLGGILEDQAGWRSSFAFVIVFGAVALIFALKGADETLSPRKRHQAHFSGLFLSFYYLLKNRIFMSYALQVSFSTSAYFTFLGGTSFVLIDLMGGTATELGFYFVAVSAFYIFGNYVTARLTDRLGIFKLILIGTVVSFCGPLLMLVTEMSVGMGAPTFFGFMCLVALGNGLCIATGVTGAISADPERVGAAAGLAGSMQIGFGAVGTFVVGLLLSYYETTPLPLILVVGICCIAAFLSLMLGRSKVGTESS
ncbi:multidrug effflux MFS transporter [Sneathiella sp.]|jgi:DHA1 family bicyclomycin/chloramphenicol resistance-like MFS transporter|uniref:multidrug effflux MFS transporter n=1 Tax=Sneathiella sp. TaxID=1964365 RepID=UPI0039E726E5